jgi:dephospho-CoA kinase
MIIGLTGRIAAGKGFVVAHLLEKSFRYVTLSQVVRDEVVKRGLPVERKNLQDVGNDVRKKEGENAWIKRVISNMNDGEDWIVNGIRNPGEVKELKKRKDFFLIALEANQKLRFERLLDRNKMSDPKTWEEFLKIDRRDFAEDDPAGQQVGACIKMADFKIENNGSLDELNASIDEIFKKMEKKIRNKK